jgi:membrane associated rhomboid family serine protease
LLKTFQDNPSDPKYQEEGRAAARMRAELEKEETGYRKKVRTRSDMFRPLTQYGFGPLTFVLLALCVAVFILSRFSDDLEAVLSLFISDPRLGGYRNLSTMLPEVRHGQVWRLFTPVFLHFGWLHIFFNMLWLKDLGSMIEGHQGTRQLAVLVIVIAACSNFGQYFVSGPLFGGMSGVIYGLLGYVWMRGKFDPASGLFLHPSTVGMMLVWFVLCYTGIFGNIAKTTHAVGLVMGVAWGYLSAIIRR